MDLSKLTDEQLAIAIKVSEAAERRGLNPEFVLPMVMQESGFNPSAKSPAGAFGVMQLMPDTAKSLKVNANNIDENIEGGMRLLKELVSDKKIGDDPYKVLAAYNASTETRKKFLESGDLNVLPDETINHMLKISEYYGGDLPKVSIAQKQETIEPEEKIIDDTTGGEDIYGGQKVTDYETNTRTPPSETGAIAGTVGATVGAFKVPVWQLAHRVSKLLPSGEKISPEAAVKLAETIMEHDAALGHVPGAGGVPVTGADAGRMAKGETGVMPYNYGKAAGLTDIEAGQALDMTKQAGGVHDLATKRRESLTRLQSKFPNQYVENPNFGGLMTPSASVGSGPRESFVMDAEGKLRAAPKPQAVPVTPPAAPAAAEMPGALSRFTRRVAGSAPVVGGLAAYGAGYGAQDVYNRLMDKKPGEAALSALGTAASAAAPFVGTAASIPLTGVGALIPAYLQMQDDPEAKARFLKGMSGKGAFANRGFGLD